MVKYRFSSVVLVLVCCCSILFAASSPNPADGTRQVETTASLSWVAGGTAVSYNVYIGTNYND